MRQQGRQAHRSVNERGTTLKHENQQKQRTKQNIIKANQNAAGIREVVDHQNQQVQHTNEQTDGDQNHRKAEHEARNTMAGERTLPKQRRKTYYEQNWKR